VTGSDSLLGETHHADVDDGVVRVGKGGELRAQRPRRERDCEPDEEPRDGARPAARLGPRLDRVAGVVGRLDPVEDLNHVAAPASFGFRGARTRAMAAASSPISSAAIEPAGADARDVPRPQGDAAA